MWGRRRPCTCREELNEIQESLTSIVLALRRINDTLKLLVRSEERPHFDWSVGPTRPKESFMPLTLTSTNEEQIRVTATPVTSTGRPAPLDGPVRVTVASGEGTVQTVDDRTFIVVSPDAPGDTTYLVEADADLGEGIVLIQDTITYTATGAMAVNLGLTAGAPEPKVR